MRAQTSLRSKRVLRHRLGPFEQLLPELTLGELWHLLQVLRKKSGSLSRNRVELVRKAIDGRRFITLQPSLATL